MSFSLAQILLFIVAYLTGLFAVAHLADRGIIPERITRHPATYVLSLGVFAGAMASNGVMELAYQYGYSFLLYYGGVVMMFVLAALLLVPLLRLCRVYQLSSLADVLTFRFRSTGWAPPSPWPCASPCCRCWPCRSRPLPTASRSWPGTPINLFSRRRATGWPGAAVLHHHHRVFHSVRHPPQFLTTAQYRTGHRHRLRVAGQTGRVAGADAGRGVPGIRRLRRDGAVAAANPR